MQPPQAISKTPERCPYCAGSKLTRRGRRQKKLEYVQLWRCKSCSHTFTPELAKGKSYPTRLIVDALAWYHQGHSKDETLRRIRRKYHQAPADSTFWKWLADYEDICSYRRMRLSLRQEFTPHRLIRSVKLYHQQVYKYSIHYGKLSALQREGNNDQRIPNLAAYLEEMRQHCRHELFTEEAKGSRASKLKGTFNLAGVSVSAKENAATETARFVLSTVANNRIRHEALQRFMLQCDSATVATEVPIALLPEDIEAFRRSGFKVPIHTDHPITGHVDFLQIRNGAIHILDYKPDARTNRPVDQLTLYALALSRAAGLRLYDYKCACFNEEGYYEFFPLHVVHKRPPVKPEIDAW